MSDHSRLAVVIECMLEERGRSLSLSEEDWLVVLRCLQPSTAELVRVTNERDAWARRAEAAEAEREALRKERDEARFDRARRGEAMSRLGEEINRLDARIGAREWRCFHCDEVFTTVECATEHFGPHELCQPTCQIDIAEYRRMEEVHQQHLSETDEATKTFWAMKADHRTELRREEEKGYAKGVADAREEALTALGLADGSPGWLPIETAPRDGTHILVCFDDPPYGPTWGFQQRPPTVAHWFGPPDLPGLRAGGWYLSVNHSDSDKIRPTHWRPLPAPPAILTSAKEFDRG